MRLAILSLVALAFLTTGLAAEAAGVQWATSFDEAMKEAQERGVLILCVFNMDGETSSEAMIQIFRSGKAFEKVSRQLVCVWGNKDPHRQIQVKVNGKKKSVCPYLGNAPCHVHKEMEQILSRKYGEVMISDDGYVKMPVQWLIDGTGKVVKVIVAGDRNAGFGEMPEGEFVSIIKEEVKKYGPGLTSDQFKQLGKLLKEGNELKAKGDYSGAAGAYHKILAVTSQKVSAVVAAEAALAEIAGFARKGLDEAKALAAAGKYAPAMELLRDIGRKYKNSSAEKEARKQLKDMLKNPKVAKLMRETESKKAAAELLAAGQKAEKAEKWKAAMKAYKACSERYAETASGQAAKKRLAELMADPTIGGTLREAAAAKDCKSWLNLAANFINNNLPDRARVYLRKVIDTYPGTSYAKKAQEMLNGIK